jgi:hypothetical protein
VHFGVHVIARGANCVCKRSWDGGACLSEIGSRCVETGNL